jgi:hypothetical protein
LFLAELLRAKIKDTKKMGVKLIKLWRKLNITSIEERGGQDHQPSAGMMLGCCKLQCCRLCQAIHA